jgi:hypothetical protein
VPGTFAFSSFVVFDDTRRSYRRIAGVLSELALGTTLPQQVPALVEFDTKLHQPCPFRVRQGLRLLELVLLGDQMLDVFEDAAFACDSIVSHDFTSFAVCMGARLPGEAAAPGL